MFATLTLAAALAAQLPPPNVRPPGMGFIPGHKPAAQVPMVENFTPFGTRYVRPAGMLDTLPQNMGGLPQYQLRYESPLTGTGGIPTHPGVHSALVGSNGLSAMESMLIGRESAGQFVGPPAPAGR